MKNCYALRAHVHVISVTHLTRATKDKKIAARERAYRIYKIVASAAIRCRNSQPHNLPTLCTLLSTVKSKSKSNNLIIQTHRFDKVPKHNRRPTFKWPECLALLVGPGPTTRASQRVISCIVHFNLTHPAFDQIVKLTHNRH